MPPTIISTSPARSNSKSWSSKPSIMETRILAFSSSIRLSARGRSSIRLIGVAPITSVPPSPIFANSISRDALSRTASIALAWRKSSLPKVFNRAPNLPRSMSWVPSCRSSMMILFVSAGCDMPSSSAARMKVPWSSMA